MLLLKNDTNLKKNKKKKSTQPTKKIGQSANHPKRKIMPNTKEKS